MAHVATITIDHTKVPGDLTDYVGLIVPDASAGYSALYALCLEGGGDIRLFKSDDTTELAREIVSFSVTDETGEIHYKYAGTLSSSVDTDIHVYADGSSSDYAVGATYGRNNVWGAFELVWHMREGSGTTVSDSTGNGHIGNFENSPAWTSSGLFGNAVSFSAATSNKRVRATGVKASDLNINGANARTVSWWAKQDSGGASGWPMSVGANSSNAMFTSRYLGSNNWRLNSFGGDLDYTQASTDGNWILQHAMYSGSALEAYVNGVDKGNYSRTINTSDGTDFQIGNAVDANVQYKGLISSVRVKSSRISDNALTTEYNNQDSYSTFYSVAAVAGGSAAQAARRGAVMMM